MVFFVCFIKFFRESSEHVRVFALPLLFPFLCKAELSLREPVTAVKIRESFLFNPAYLRTDGPHTVAL